MKKRLCLCLALLLLAFACMGCGGKKSNIFTQENEILTYDRVDPEKTVLLVSMLGNDAKVPALSAAFEERNPDVQVVCIDITGGDGAYLPTDEWIKHGMAPDLMFSNDPFLKENNNGAEHMTDLSASPVLAQFEVGSLDRLAVDGHAYYLPGPSEVNCMCYNKTMFEFYGWETPETFDEFVALCLRIREDTDGQVQPWNPNAKYDNVFSTALRGFTYGELFAGVDNAQWYSDFCAGKGTFAGHMEPMYELIQTLIDNGILLEEHFTYSATTRGKEFQEGKIAMINMDASTLYDEGLGFEMGFFPYPSTDGEPGFVSTTYTLILCEPKKERTPAMQDAVDRYLAFFASVEGQEIIIGDSLLISNVKDMPTKEHSVMADVEAAIAKGNRFAFFVLGGTDRYCSLKNNAFSMLEDGKTAAEVIAAVDAMPVETGEETDDARTVIAQVAEGGLTILEFSCYIADLYRETAGADIGLINHGVAFRGNLVRLFEGDMYDAYVRVLKPRSFDNGSTLIKASMTGRQLLDALNHPGNGEKNSDSVYAFSGLCCTLAPWNELGSKVLSVKLADGTPLEEDKLYSVAFWAGSVADAYITEVLETYEGTWEELMTAKMQQDGTIAPADDGRFTLVWD